VKAFNGCHQPKKSKAINEAKGEKKTEVRQSLTDFITTEENKEGVVSKESIVRVIHSETRRVQA
jgi:hypothetical protein